MIDPANISCVYVKDGELKAFGMFPITASTLTISGDTMAVDITMTGKTTYSGLYIGEQTEADASSLIAGTAVTDEAGTTIGYSFHFDLPASARGTYVRVTPAKAGGAPATSEAYLAIPDADGNVTGTRWRSRAK